MPERGDLTKKLNCGESVSLSEGHYIGGTITANSLSDQTHGTATSGDLLINTTAYVNGLKITGTMPHNGAQSMALNCGQSKSIPSGFTSGGTVTANSLASQTGGATLSDGDALSGKTYWKDGVKRTGTIPTLGAQAVTPGASAKTVSCNGKYMTGNITVNGDSNLVASNIISGKSIFGVSGNQRVHRYAHGNVVSSSVRDVNGELYKIAISLGFTPVVGYVLYYNGNGQYRDITIYSPDTGVGKSYSIVNFNQERRFGFASWGGNNGDYGIIIGPNLVIPVSYGGVTYSYWFAGY